MKALIRNCQHGSNLYLLEEMGPGGATKAFYKSASSQEGIHDLRQEIEGLRWYNQRVHRPIAMDVVGETPHYLSVKFDFREGDKASYKGGYYRNREWIASILEHYCSVWGALPVSDDGLYPLHGDLSLDNVLLTDDGPVILDWEHFSEKVAPLGFDGLYLLFESLWFESGNKKPRTDSISHLAGMVRLMRGQKCLDRKFLHQPLFQIIEFIKRHSPLWGAQLSEFKFKLPVLMFCESVVKMIDQELELLIKP